MLVSLHIYVVFLIFPLTVVIQYCVFPNRSRSGFWFLEDMSNISKRISLSSLWHIGLEN